MAVAEWLAHWLHMQEVQGSNPGLGMLSFSCQMLKNLTKIGFVACQLLHFPSDFQQIHFNGDRVIQSHMVCIDCEDTEDNVLGQTNI